MAKKREERVIKTTEDLMRIKKKFEQESQVEFVYDGAKYVFRLRRPFAEKVKGIELDIFKGMVKPEHADLIRKIAAGEELTEDEKKIVEAESVEASGNLLSAKAQLNRILSRLLEPPEDEKEAYDFWEVAPFAFEFAAYMKLIDAIGVSEDSFRKVKEENPDLRIEI